jgi:hypothetical protein
MMETAQGIWNDTGKKDSASSEAVKILIDYFKEIGRIK